MEPKKQHQFKATNIDNHPDGSRSVHHEHESDPKKDVKYATANLDGVHEGMDKHLGTPEAAPSKEAPGKEDQSAQATPGATGAASNSPTTATRNTGAATGGAVTVTISGSSSTDTATTTGAGAGKGSGKEKGSGEGEKPHVYNISVDARGTSGNAVDGE